MKLLRIVVLFLFTLAMAGCGGGGSSSSGGGGTPPAQNKAPTVNAGGDQVVDENTDVTLTATASDSDGSIASYSWVQTGDVSVSLSASDSASVSFTAPEVMADTTITFEVTVTDNDGATDKDSVSVQIVIPNESPTVNAGDDQPAVVEQTDVTLTGSAGDSDGTIVSYKWTQLPGGTTVTLVDADKAIASFTAPDILADETLTFQLQVTDDDGATATDTVAITVTRLPNQLPTASAGEDMQTDEQTEITLNGVGTDLDGTIASYSWTQLSGTMVKLRHADSSELTLVTPNVDNEETLEFELTVTDNEGGVTKDTVKIDLSLLVADYFIDQADSTLVRYADGDTLNYAFQLDFRGNSNAPASENTGQYVINYVLSSNPVSPIGIDSITKKMEVTIQDTLISNIAQEVVQFPDNIGVSSDEYVFIERRLGNVYGQDYDGTDSNGALTIPGEPTIGYSLDESYINHRYDNPDVAGDDAADYDVVQKMDIDRIEVIKTPLGNFEAYRLQLNYSETDTAGKVDSQVGTFWLYPGIGFIKAEYVESIGTQTPTGVSDISYLLNSTTVSF